jgi:hypothetical protein
LVPRRCWRGVINVEFSTRRSVVIDVCSASDAGYQQDTLGQSYLIGRSLHRRRFLQVGSHDLDSVGK